MSPLWRDDLRVALCPGRLVYARYSRRLARRLIEQSIVPLSGDPIPALAELTGKADVTVVLSNHYVRYGVLRWSAALRSSEEWLAYAQHHFFATHGAVAAGWRVSVSAARRGRSRIACAIDADLFERLRSARGVRSLQPYLMSAFNARRHALSRPAWFVLQEPGRLTIGLPGSRGWELVRNRQAPTSWRESLASLLDREGAARNEATPDEVNLCCEDEAPEAAARIGRYRITDLSLPRGTSLESRAVIMACH